MIWHPRAERLTPYATAYRYPGELLAPDIKEYLQAYQDAEAIVAFVTRNFRNNDPGEMGLRI